MKGREREWARGTGRKGEERSTLVDDPASKEPLHARAGHEGVSNQPSYLLHRHLHPLSRRPGAGSDTQPIVGPRLITTLPNVRPSHRGRVRHGGPRVSRSLVTSSGVVIRSDSRLSAIVRRFIWLLSLFHLSALVEATASFGFYFMYRWISLLSFNPRVHPMLLTSWFGSPRWSFLLIEGYLKEERGFSIGWSIYRSWLGFYCKWGGEGLRLGLSYLVRKTNWIWRCWIRLHAGPRIDGELDLILDFSVDCDCIYYCTYNMETVIWKQLSKQCSK